MDPKAALVAAKITGKMRVVVGLGRLDYIGRFQPFGQLEVEATVRMNPDGLWTARVQRVRVMYDHPSPRIITHVGMFMYDQWMVDPLNGERVGQAMKNGDVAVFDVEHPLPEEL